MLKNAIRLCSILLIIALLVNMMPMQVFAQMYQSNASATQDSTVQTATDTAAETSEEAEIVGEVEEKRTEFSKEHILSNGLHMMTLYPDAVHYETENGWEEIDNTLKLSTDGTYTNTAGVWQVSLPQQLSGTKPVTITKDGYTLSFAMAGQLRTNDLQLSTRAAIGTEEKFHISAVQAVSAQIQPVEEAALRQSLAHPETLPDKLTSRIAYKSVFANTDVLYDLDSNKVKESVILQSYDSALRGYRYTLQVGTMIPVLEEDGQITLYASDKQTVVMVMPAPFLVDDNNRYSYDVQVQLTGSGSSYTLTYLLPNAWLADSSRTWPVVLDPVVEADFAASNIQDQTVAEDHTYSHTWGMGEVGYYDGYGAERFFIQYETLPTLTSADVVVGATIQLCMDGHGENTPMQVHKVSDTWTSTGITWANQPAFGEYIEDFAVLDEPGYYSFTVTEIVRDWYANKNTGMVFRFSDSIEAGSADNWIQFYSSDYGNYKPLLSVIFRNNAGLEGYWDYTTASAGRAGTGYVNQYTGNLVWTRDDIGFGGNRMPVSISHVYNANESKDNLFGMGYGWRTNFNQRVYHWDDDNAVGDYYIWEDADGTKHYFLNISTGTYIDEDGLELTLKTTGSGTKKYSIEDKYGNISYFDTNGRLTQQTNNQATESSITVTYTTTSGRKISTITDGVGRKYTFTYTDDLLSKIAYKSKGSTALTYVNFGYSSSNLTSVTDKDGEVSSYTYTSNHLLATATDVDGYKLSYAYNTTATGRPNRIKSITEYDGSVLGSALTVDYAQNMTTITDHQGNQEVIQFNNWGNTISAYDNQGRAVYSQFASNDPKESGKGNQLRLSSKMQNTVGNHITSSNFDTDVTYSNSSAKISNSIASGIAYSGNKSLEIVTNETAQGSRPYVYYSYHYIPVGQSVTYSAYLKTGAVPANLTIHDGTNEVEGEVLPANSDWTRVQVTYTNNGTEEVRIIPRTRVHGVGTVYMDCVQFETAASASRFNLVGNGDFRNIHYWSSTAGRVNAPTTVPAPELNAKSYKLNGSPTATKRVSQTIPISGNAGDSYVLGGWAMGRSAPLRDDRKFGLIAVFNNTDDTTTEKIFNFNPDVSTWQYMSNAIVAEKPYESVTIRMVFDYNVNTVYFDGIQLFKETFGQSYTYDDDGNITSVTDLQNQRTDHIFDSDNHLIKTFLPSGAELTYTYDDHHNVLTATSAEGLVYHFTYDAYGNNTSVSMTSGGKTLTSTATYTSDGNRLASTTDALGKTTTYSYNSNTNVLEWVKYPEDTEATRTEYTYDSMYRIATAAADVDSGYSLNAAYTYTDDQLTKITTNSTAYTFTYGDFALRSGIKIGSRVLASYAYDENQNLKALDYGNGDSVKYTYNKQGQVTQQTYEDGTTITYAYDNSGALATVTDSATGRKTAYYYDLLDRMMKYVESGDEYSHSVEYTYDERNNMSKIVEVINGTERDVQYAYDEDNRLESLISGQTEKSSTYDDFGRVNQQQTKHGENTVKTDSYTFTEPSAGTTSGQIGQHTIQSQNGDLNKTYSYTYDDNGNITAINDGTNTVTYVYDSANQLIRENNPVGDFTYVWTYDSAGNILSRTQYPYTTGELGTATETVIYAYGDSTWGDLLTAYNGQSITYDAIGNPLSDGTWTYTWEHGRRLATMTAGETIWDFAYNADGMRIYRSNGATTYRYVYNGDQLSQMEITEEATGQKNLLTFSYDAAGLPMTVDYDGTTYYYVTNLQGDVIAIADDSGNVKVEYTYDAWGNPLSISGSMASTLGIHNPLRYRGYVYDSETNLYYLQSRYYDAEIGRWINADDSEMLLEDYEAMLQYNLFAYCWNNPVNMYDPDGYWTLALAGGGYLATAGTLGASNIWNPVGWVILGTVAVVAVGVTVYKYSEHRTTKNGKKTNKHQKGNARRKRDQGGEKKKLKPEWKKKKR